jgi:hypothetical protein
LQSNKIVSEYNLGPDELQIETDYGSQRSRVQNKALCFTTSSGREHSTARACALQLRGAAHLQEDI